MEVAESRTRGGLLPSFVSRADWADEPLRGAPLSEELGLLRISRAWSFVGEQRPIDEFHPSGIGGKSNPRKVPSGQSGDEVDAPNGSQRKRDHDQLLEARSFAVELDVRSVSDQPYDRRRVPHVQLDPISHDSRPLLGRCETRADRLRIRCWSLMNPDRRATQPNRDGVGTIAAIEPGLRVDRPVQRDGARFEDGKANTCSNLGDRPWAGRSDDAARGSTAEGGENSKRSGGTRTPNST